MEIQPNPPSFNQPIYTPDSQPLGATSSKDPIQEVEELLAELSHIPTGNDNNDANTILRVNARLKELVQDPNLPDKESIQNAIDQLDQTHAHAEKRELIKVGHMWVEKITSAGYDATHLAEAQNAIQWWPGPPPSR